MKDRCHRTSIAPFLPKEIPLYARPAFVIAMDASACVLVRSDCAAYIVTSLGGLTAKRIMIVRLGNDVSRTIGIGSCAW